LSSSARGDKSASLAAIRNASRPPRWSTVLRALAETRKRTDRPSASESIVTLSRLGRNRRLVLRLEWLTRCPIWRVLPVSSHRHAMVKVLQAGPIKPIPLSRSDDAQGAERHRSWHLGMGRTYSGGALRGQGAASERFGRGLVGA